MKEPITGGTIFWLNAGIDRGDIIRIGAGFPLNTFKPSKIRCKTLARYIAPDGSETLESALNDILNGVIKRTPQDKRFSTFEPDTNVKDIYRPDS
jgi:methionyl-tRNA formyltransferase